MTLYFNSTDGPITIDDDGHSVGGWEWFECDLTDQIRSAIDRGAVVRLTQSAKSSKYDNVPVSFNPDDVSSEPIEVEPDE